MTELGVFLLVPMLAVAGASVAAWWRSTRQRPGARRARALPVTLECGARADKVTLRVLTSGEQTAAFIEAHKFARHEPHRGRVR